MPTTTTAKRTSSRKSKTAQPIIVNEIGRQQPQALDFEEAVLGACLIEKDAFGLVGETLNPSSFYDTKHQLIYHALQQLATENKPIDVLTVTNQLRANGELDDAGGMYYIAELSQKVLSSAHIEYHAQIIAQKALARQMITFASGVLRDAFDDGQDVNELMQKAQGYLFELSKTSMKKDFTQIDPVIKEAFELLHKAAGNVDGMSGIPSGFDKLDAITNGWQKSDLIIIAARPAMGKTAFVLSMAKNIAVNYKIPVAMFSLEMSNVQLVNRLIVNVCEISGDKIRSGKLDPYEWTQLDTKINELYNAPLYIDDTPSLSVFELRSKARRLVKEHGVQMIIIDYLQLMNASGMSYNSRQEEVSTISRSLKQLAKELSIPIIALSQLNRGVENRPATEDNPDNKRPQLSDLRESGAIEQDADMVCMIHRPEYYHLYKDAKGQPTKGVAEIIIAKHRNGQVGDVRLKFVSDYARFANIDEAVFAPVGDEPVPIMSSMNTVDDEDPFGSVPPPGADMPF